MNIYLIFISEKPDTYWYDNEAHTIAAPSIIEDENEVFLVIGNKLDYETISRKKFPFDIFCGDIKYKGFNLFIVDVNDNAPIITPSENPCEIEVFTKNMSMIEC